ncbi:MAG: 30S ribosome-binding factor RbfA [Magnetococcales bacterium]|nr:30S ribosome-binding factor RbfA [Magnetococcales bacterium]
MSVRTNRAAGLIRQEIASMLLAGEVHDPRLSGFVSITDVEMSRDLQYATVFYSVYGTSEEREGEVLDGLVQAAGFIRRQLGRRLKMRHVPELRFKPDLSFKEGEKIEKILHQIKIPAAVKEE